MIAASGGSFPRHSVCSRIARRNDPVVHLILHSLGAFLISFMVFSDICHDRVDCKLSEPMMSSDKSTTLSLSLVVPYGDKPGNLFNMCQQDISVFVSIGTGIQS